MAYLMLNFGMVSDRVEETLELYFQQCSILVNARDLAIMAATLANGGVNPITSERAIEERYVKDVISVMLTCGMYDYSGEWAYGWVYLPRAGLAAALAWCPAGSASASSRRCSTRRETVRRHPGVRGSIRDFGLHMFNAARPGRELKEWMDSADTPPPPASPYPPPLHPPGRVDQSALCRYR